MPTEIEHKYLVNHALWKQIVPDESKAVKQGYLSSSAVSSVRVRVLGDQGFVTIKGKSTNASRLEYEYEIPLAHAEEMLATFCSQDITKTRHYVQHGAHTWEVDEFHGPNAGLIVAEIELSSVDEQYELPEWIGENVTTDKRYSNANLVLRPFTTW
jgi:CYTH domain-containing protein